MTTKPLSKQELITQQMNIAANALLVLKEHIPMKPADKIELKNLLFKMYKVEKRLQKIEFYGGYEKKIPFNQRDLNV